MKKLVLLTLVFLLACSCLSGCGSSEKEEAKELVIYTWEEYLPEEVLARFEEETGIHIIYTNFETNEEMLAKLENAKGGDYDLVLASDYIIKIAADQDLVQELDLSKIPNYKNIDPIYQGFFYDPENNLTVPYAPGIPLIVYDPSRVDIEITGYADLWDPSLKDSVGLMDTERVIMGMALKVLGESFNTNDLDKIQEAGDLLLELAPNVRILNQDQTHDYLLSGEISAAFLFTNQVAEAVAANPDLKVVYPKEGLGFGVDAFFIPSAAPHPDAAHEFLNYILDGEVGAEISSWLMYMCPNKAAYPYLPEEFQASLMISEGDIPEGEFIMDVSEEATALHAELYTAFKNAMR